MSEPQRSPWWVFTDSYKAVSECNYTGDGQTFDIKVTNTSKLNAELYVMSLRGLSSLDQEVIEYDILPLDYINV